MLLHYFYSQYLLNKVWIIQYSILYIYNFFYRKNNFNALTFLFKIKF